MKKTVFVMGMAFITLAGACTKVKTVVDTNVDIPYSTSVAVPASVTDTSVALPAGGLSVSFPNVSMATGSKEFLSQYNTNPDRVVSVDLKGASIEIETPSNTNFDYMDSIELYVSAAGQPETLMAYEYGVPKGQKVLDLVSVPNVNLKSYYLQDAMLFRVKAHINATPPTGEQLTIATVMHLLANPLN